MALPLFLRYCKQSRGQVIKSAPVAGIKDGGLIRAFDVLASLPGVWGRKQPQISTGPPCAVALRFGAYWCVRAMRFGVCWGKAGLLRRLSLFREPTASVSEAGQEEA